MKNKILKILGIVMTIAMLSSFMVAGTAVSASPGVNDWDGITLPTEDWYGSDVTLLDFDGTTIYGAVCDSSWNWLLVKSTDGGYTWTETEMDDVWYAASPVTGYISDIVVSPAGDGVIYVAFSSGEIYKVADDGEGSITALRTLVNEEGIEASALYDIDVYYDEGGDVNYVLAGTNIDALVLKDAGFTEEWVPLGLIDFLGTDNVYGQTDLLDDTEVDYSGYGVLEVAFAPDFAESSIIWAVYDTGDVDLDGITDSGDYCFALVSTLGTGTWNTIYDEIVFDGADAVDDLAATDMMIDMAFPTDYDSDDPYLYLALNSGSDGNIYLCVIDNYLGNSETDALLTTDTAMSSVEVAGNVILAGETWTGTVYRSDDAGDTFDAIDVIGGWLTNVYIMVDPDQFDEDNGWVYVATSGWNSGVSRSTDGGQTYVQLGLIDLYISDVFDVAFITEGATQAAVLITGDGMDNSVWRTADITASDTTIKWERILVSGFDGNVDYMAWDAEVSEDGSVVMIYVEEAFGAGYSIYKSTDDGYTYSQWKDLATAVEIINDWVVIDGSTIYCATTGGFYGTSRFGPATTELDTETLVSIAVSDDTVIVGTDDGLIYISTDSGETWGAAYDTLGGAVNVYVAFDADFADNGLIYYATADGVVGQCAVVGSIVDIIAPTDTGLLLDSTDAEAAGDWYNDIIVADDNALYVSGGTGSVVTSTTYTIDGTVDFLGSISGVADTGIDLTSAHVVLSTVTVTSTATFTDTEGISIYAASVYAESSSIITGRIYIEGDTSGAQGYFDVTIYGVGIYYALGGDLSLGEDVAVSENIANDLDVDIATSSTSSAASMYRILLGEEDNVWEPAPLADMWNLWYSEGSNILWTVANYDELYAFEDFLSDSVTVSSVVEINNSTLTSTKTIKVSWLQLNGAEEYEILVVNDATGAETTYSYVLTAAQLSETNSKYVEAGDTLTKTITGLADNTEYSVYVRVVAGGPYQSRWSAEKSVTTEDYIAAPTAATNLIPETGSIDVPVTGQQFDWAAVTGATGYTIQFSTDSAFATILEEANITVDVYEIQATLDYSTTYYWRVRATTASGYSAWVTSAFTTVTEELPVVTVTQTSQTQTLTVSGVITTIAIEPIDITIVPPASTVTVPTSTVVSTYELAPVVSSSPAYIWAIVAIGGLLTIAVIILIIRTRRVV